MITQLVVCAALLSLVGCAGVQHRQDAALSKSVYGTQAAFKAGRFDLAEEYNGQAVRLLPPPKKPLPVHAFTSKGKTYAVLPPAFQNVPATSTGSTLFTTALGQDKALQGEMDGEAKALEGFSKEVDSVVRAKDAEAAKFENAKPSLWAKIIHWVRWLSIPLLIAGVTALCVFCPAAIPFVLAAWKLLRAFLGAVVSAFIVLIGDVQSLFKPKGASG